MVRLLLFVAGWGFDAVREQRKVFRFAKKIAKKVEKRIPIRTYADVVDVRENKRVTQKLFYKARFFG